MSAIEAATVRVATMADGTLRLTVDVEPRFAVDAFRLFGSPGVPLALAALKIGAEPEPEKPKGGEISKWVAMRCGEGRFQDWLGAEFTSIWSKVEMESPSGAYSRIAAEVVRRVCRVESRAHLDHDKAAADEFHRLIRGPYSKHLIACGVVA